MGLSLLTVMTLANNYPDNVLVTAGGNEESKWSGFIYLLRDGEIHRCLANSQPVYDSEVEAKTEIKNYIEKIIEGFTVKV